MDLCVVGTGYVGLVTGACFAEMGNKVICVDIDQNKIDKLKQGIMPIYEAYLEEMCRKNSKEGRLKFTTCLREGVEEADIVFIAVGTPSLPDGNADLSQVIQAALNIAAHLKKYKVIAIKSTVPVGTQKLITKIIRENQGSEAPFDVVSNPEFLREGTAVHDMFYPDRIVIGSDSQKAAEIMVELHEPFHGPIIITNPESAEMIKYAANAFLATKISFINEIANLCEKLGADILEVSRGIGLDKRISADFLRAGVGFGGACFPKDIKALIKTAEKTGCELKIVKSTLAANEMQKKVVVEKLVRALPDMKDKRIAILGLSFKPNTDDMREAPSIDIIREIKKMGGQIKAYDPAAMANAQSIIPDIEYCQTPYQAVLGADAIILVTEWELFRKLDMLKIKQLARGNIFIDGRNVFDYHQMKELGFEYYCIGRKDSSWDRN